MQKIYRIHLSAEERDSLTALTTSSKPISAKKVIKARALLLADESDSGPSLSDVEIMKATGMKPATLVRLRQRVGEKALNVNSDCGHRQTQPPKQPDSLLP